MRQPCVHDFTGRSVGGHRLHVLSRGEAGGPTVVLDAGLGQASMAWGLVAPGVTPFARVVAYDRAGYAWSDPGRAPRTAGRLAGELSALLKNAAIPGPHVLVAHSVSGLTARLFAARFPGEVAGMVLLDAVHEDLWSLEPGLFGGYFGALAWRFRSLSSVARTGALRLAVRLGFAEKLLPGFVTGQPEETRPALLAGYLSGKNFAAAAREAEALRAVAEGTGSALSAGVPEDLPLVVLSHGVPSMFSGLPAAEARSAERAWQEAQARMAETSRRGRLVIAEESGHDVHADRPDLVVEAVRRVVEESGS